MFYLNKWEHPPKSVTIQKQEMRNIFTFTSVCFNSILILLFEIIKKEVIGSWEGEGETLKMRKNTDMLYEE